MSRLAVMAHFDVAGELRPHVRGQVEALAASVDTLLVCTTAQPAGLGARLAVNERAVVVERANYGYDFFSYKVGLDAAGDLTAYDEVVVCNDTYVFALDSYAPVFDEMATRPCDFWGLTAAERVAPHIQSFFIAFRPWVVGSHAFTSFWEEMEPISKRRQVIRRYEVGMSRRLYDAGFASDTYFVETPEDRRIARERMRWWAAHRSPLPAHARRGPRVARAGQRAVEPRPQPGRPGARQRPAALRQDRHPALRPLQPRRQAAARAVRASLPAALRRASASSSRRPRSTTRCATPSGCCPRRSPSSRSSPA